MITLRMMNARLRINLNLICLTRFKVRTCTEVREEAKSCFFDHHHHKVILKKVIITLLQLTKSQKRRKCLLGINARNHGGRLLHKAFIHFSNGHIRPHHKL